MLRVSTRRTHTRLAVIALLALGAVASAQPAAGVSLVVDTRYVTDIYYVCDPVCGYAGDTVTAQDVYGADFAPEVHLATGTSGRTAMTLDNILSASATDLELSGSAAAWTGQDVAWGSSILRVEFILDVASSYSLTSSLSAGKVLGGSASAQLSLEQLLPDYQELTIRRGELLVLPYGPRASETTVSGSGTLAPGTYQFRIDASAFDLGVSRVDFDLDLAAVPEPATAALVAVALAVFACSARRLRSDRRAPVARRCA